MDSSSDRPVKVRLKSDPSVILELVLLEPPIARVRLQTRSFAAIETSIHLRSLDVLGDDGRWEPLDRALRRNVPWLGFEEVKGTCRYCWASLPPPSTCCATCAIERGL